MPTKIYWNQEKIGSDMIIETSSGETIILSFDDALNNAVPAIARYMGETKMDVLYHFAGGQHLQIDDDALATIA